MRQGDPQSERRANKRFRPDFVRSARFLLRESRVRGTSDQNNFIVDIVYSV